MATMSYLGIGSGIDMGKILDALLAAKAKPIEAVRVQQGKVQAAEKAWTSIGSDLSTLLGFLDELRMPSIYRTTKTTSTDDKVATATVSNDQLKPGQNYSIRVLQLASAQSMYSNKVALGTGGTISQTGTLDLTLNGETYLTVDYSGKSLQQVADAINQEALNIASAATEQSALEAGEGNKGQVFVPAISASIIDGRLIIQSTEGGADNSFTVADSNGAAGPFGNFDLGSGRAYWESGLLSGSDTVSLTAAFGDPITVSRHIGESQESFVDRINRAYSAMTGDSRAAVYLNDDGGGTTLRVDTSVVEGATVNGTDLKGTAIKYSGQDAVLNINGLTVRSSSNEVKNADGLTINVRETGSTTLTVASAADDVVTAVRSFVSKYNATIISIKSRTENNLPSTPVDNASDMQSMLNSRDPLYSDSSLRSLSRDLQDMFSYVSSEGAYKTFTSLGMELQRDGTIKFDDDKMRKAIETDVDTVMTFFRSVAAEGIEEGSVTFERTGGFANKANDMLKRYTNAASGIVEMQKSYYLRLQNSYKQQIQRMTESLSREEDTLTRKFSAADVAMANANSQLIRLQSLLSSVSSSSGDIMSMFGM
ncbi:MAG: flagellar filament capping protein FliD [Symbiobacteriaceae bacterium]|nr:flagellar filament capping protein FliD [Symbiobacteriaceae bacterium]